jgi:REP element-mobilizing transposase RayT
MSQSLAKIYVHLIFSTKNRERVLTDDLRLDLHSYVGGILNGLGCVPVEINSESDHIHILLILARTEPVSNVVAQVKKSSNDWLRTQDERFASFHWQAGYGAFSVSQSVVEDVREYLRKQREHHRQRTFQEEYRALLLKYAVEFDERYVWD